VARTEKTKYTHAHTHTFDLGEGNVRERADLVDPGLDYRDDFKVDLIDIGWGGVDWVSSGVGLEHEDLRFV